MLVPVDRVNLFSIDSEEETVRITIQAGYGTILKSKLSLLLALAVQLKDDVPPDIEIWEGDKIRVKIPADTVLSLINP
jgi:hypothetical protein